AGCVGLLCHQRRGGGRSNKHHRKKQERQKNQPTGRRLPKLSPPAARLFSNPPLDPRRSDARIAENGFATSGGPSKSAKVVLGRVLINPLSVSAALSMSASPSALRCLELMHLHLRGHALKRNNRVAFSDANDRLAMNVRSFGFAVMATCVLCAAANASDPIVGVLLNAGRPVGSTCPVQLSEVKRFGGFLGMLFGGPLGQPVGSLTGETAGIAEGYAKAEAGATDLHGFAIATKLPHETQPAADGSTYSAPVYSCFRGAAY